MFFENRQTVLVLIRSWCLSGRPGLGLDITACCDPCFPIDGQARRCLWPIQRAWSGVNSCCYRGNWLAGWTLHELAGGRCYSRLSESTSANQRLQLPGSRPAKLMTAAGGGQAGWLSGYHRSGISVCFWGRLAICPDIRYSVNRSRSPEA